MASHTCSNQTNIIVPQNRCLSLVSRQLFECAISRFATSNHSIFAFFLTIKESLSPSTMFKPTWIVVAAMLAGQLVVLAAPYNPQADPSLDGGYGYPGGQRGQTPWSGHPGGQVTSPTEKEPEYDAQHGQDSSYGNNHKAQPDSHQYPSTSPPGSISSATGKPAPSPWRPGQDGSSSDGAVSPSWQPSPKSPTGGPSGEKSPYDTPSTGDDDHTPAYSGLNNSTPPTTGWGGGAVDGSNGSMDSPGSKNDTGYPYPSVSSPNSSNPPSTDNDTTISSGCGENLDHGVFPYNSTLIPPALNSTTPDNTTTIPPSSGKYPTLENCTTPDNSTTTSPGSGDYPTPDNSTTTPTSSGNCPAPDNNTATPPSDDDSYPSKNGTQTSTGSHAGSGASDDGETQPPVNGTMSSSTSKKPHNPDSSYNSNKGPDGSISSATGHKKPGDPYKNTDY